MEKSGILVVGGSGTLGQIMKAEACTPSYYAMNVSVAPSFDKTAIPLMERFEA